MINNNSGPIRYSTNILLIRDMECIFFIFIRHRNFIDIDKLENPELTKTQLKLDQYVICVWTSPSGYGLKALFYLDYKTPINENIWILHEHCAFPQIDNYLLSKYGIHIDKAGADIARLCFVSSDSEIHLKKDFQPFPVYITLDKKQIWKLRTKYYYGNKSVRNAILNEKRISKLTNNNISDFTAAH